MNWLFGIIEIPLVSLIYVNSFYNVLITLIYSLHYNYEKRFQEFDQHSVLVTISSFIWIV